MRTIDIPKHAELFVEGANNVPFIKENVLRWCECLEATNKRQTIGALHKYKGGYCCLGIACGVLGIEKTGCTTEVMSNDKECKVWEYGGSTADLPDSARFQLGLKDSFGNFSDNQKNYCAATALSDLNDVRHFTFKEIAGGYSKSVEATIWV